MLCFSEFLLNFSGVECFYECFHNMITHVKVVIYDPIRKNVPFFY